MYWSLGTKAHRFHVCSQNVAIALCPSYFENVEFKAVQKTGLQKMSSFLDKTFVKPSSKIILNVHVICTILESNQTIAMMILIH